MAVYPSGIASDADLYVALDNFGTTLNGAITDVQTTITLTSTTGLPTVGILTIGAEKVKYTGVSGFDITGCTRGFSSTVAAAHVDGSNVEFNVIEEHHNGLKDEIIAIETHLGVNSANIVHIAGTETIAGTKTLSSFSGTLAANLAAGGFKLTGLGAGTTNGDSVRYQDVVRIADTQTITGLKSFSDQILASDGSVSLPGISFSGDTDTGFYRIGSNSVGLVAGGAGRFFFDTTAFMPFSSAEELGSTSQPWKTIYLQNGSASSPTYTFGSDTDTGMYRISSDFVGISVGGTLRFSVGSGATTSVFNFLPDATASLRDIGSSSQMWQNIYATGIVGTTTNNNATAGNVGEEIRSFIAGASAVSSTGTGQWFDVTSISLTAGDWDIACQLITVLNGATLTSADVATSSTSGNSATGLSLGDNWMGVARGTATENGGGTIAQFRVSLSGTTTYYLKANLVFTVATPKAFGRISARRIR